MEASIKRFYLIDIGIPFAALFAVIILAVLLRGDIMRRVEMIQTTRETLASRARAVEVLASLREDRERARIYSSVLGNILPSRDQLISFPKEFELIAKKHDVRLAAAFAGETKATASDPGAIDFSFQVRGSYANIVAFFAAAETSRYILSWASFEFLKEKGDAYSATIFGRVFTR